MCGLVGLVERTRRIGPEAFSRMLDALRHRGPDDSGQWHDQATGVTLGHRRLAVVDLSAAGHQPMVSPDGRWIVAYNGEIYNHLEFRQALPEYPWRGTSDTESLLAAIQVWGLERALRAAVGMFALAVWDKASNRMYLARDRMGEKPLYFGRLKEAFICCSDLSVLRAYPCAELEVSPAALTDYLRYGYIPAPRSIISGFEKLPPGHWMAVQFDRSGAQVGVLQSQPYWSIAETLSRRVSDRARGGQDVVDAFHAVLGQSVRGQMLADVPVGAFLSGGIDSSLIVSLMQENSRHRVRTFTIGFTESAFNEAEHAKRIARHLGTDHTEVYLEGRAALDLMPKMAGYFDEPFGDDSQVATYLVSKLARGAVTVALSGDGGDELLLGYGRYFQAGAYWRTLSLLRKLPAWTLSDRVLERFPRVLGRKLRIARSLMAHRTLPELYERLMSTWPDPGEILLAPAHDARPFTGGNLSERSDSIQEAMSYHDMLRYLPDCILTKVDRAAMAVSLETRAPFLDHRVVEFALDLPAAYKVRGGQGKWLSRALLRRYVPNEMFDRPKQGFSIPINSWLRGPLREWGEELLDPASITGMGLFRAEALRQEWDEHQQAVTNHGRRLWALLMFLAWARHWKGTLRLGTESTPVQPRAIVRFG